MSEYLKKNTYLKFFLSCNQKDQFDFVVRKIELQELVLSGKVYGNISDLQTKGFECNDLYCQLGDNFCTLRGGTSRQFLRNGVKLLTFNGDRAYH